MSCNRYPLWVKTVVFLKVKKRLFKLYLLGTSIAACYYEWPILKTCYEIMIESSLIVTMRILWVMDRVESRKSNGNHGNRSHCEEHAHDYQRIALRIRDISINWHNKQGFVCEISVIICSSGIYYFQWYIVGQLNGWTNDQKIPKTYE